MSSSQSVPTSYTLGPTPEGATAINLSTESWKKAFVTAARWRGSGPAFVFIGSALTECRERGLIGVSRPIIKVIDACAEEARRETPLLLIGELGTELVPAAESVHALANDEASSYELPRLRCGGLTEDVLRRKPGQPYDELDRFLGAGSPGRVLLTDIECAPLPVQRRFLSALDNPTAARMLATTHESATSLERMAENKRLLPELLQRLRKGRVIEVPPLSMRPEDLPLLIYYYLQRYHRGDYDPPRGEVRAVAAEWLYFAAGRRWQWNLDELEESVRDACREAARIDGTVCVWQPGGAQAASRPAECPFVLPPHAFFQAASQDRERFATVPVEDLPDYDLKALLEAVDAHAEPHERWRWTVESRRQYLERERVGRRQDAAETVPANATGDDGDDVRKEAMRATEPRHHSDEFSHNDDYSSVKSHGQNYLLRGRATEVIRLLHQALLSTHPWVHKDRIATELNYDAELKNAAPFRVRDVFATTEQYRALVESTKRGYYRLRV